MLNNWCRINFNWKEVQISISASLEIGVCTVNILQEAFNFIYNMVCKWI